MGYAGAKRDTSLNDTFVYYDTSSKVLVREYLFFLFLLQNIDCGYSLEPPRLLTCTHKLCFGAKIRKNLKDFLMKFSIFTVEKNRCILHGQVFEMWTICKPTQLSEHIVQRGGG